MQRSTIGWTDYSGGACNFVGGCTPVSEGCQHCYARALYQRFGRDHRRVTLYPDKLAQLARVHFPPDGHKRGPGSQPMCFVCDTGDLFHDAVPDEFIRDAFQVMSQRHDVTWQVLTKRAARMGALLRDVALAPNIWLGVTAETQARADERIPLLLGLPAAVRFVSIEPMLEPVDLTRLGYDGDLDAFMWAGRIDWVIVGAESGPQRRPFNPAWAGDVYQVCRDNGVACFLKQDSALTPGAPLLYEGHVVHEWPQGKGVDDEPISNALFNASGFYRAGLGAGPIALSARTRAARHDLRHHGPTHHARLSRRAR